MSDQKVAPPQEHPNSCACPKCEKRRAKDGSPLLNPRAATGEATEMRPGTDRIEHR